MAEFGRAGVLGQASLLAYWLGSGPKVLRGGGWFFSATERAHKRNGGQVEAEWRRRSFVTHLATQGQSRGTKIVASREEPRVLRVLTLDKKLFGIHALGVTPSSSTSSATEAKEKKSKIRLLVDDTNEFFRISKLRGGLVPQSMVGTILNVSRQRVHQLVSEGVFSHWTFYGMKWLSQDEVVAFGKLHRQAGENQHKPSAKQMWKDSREAGRDYIKGRRPHGY